MYIVVLIIASSIDVLYYKDSFGVCYFLENLNRSESFLVFAPIHFIYFTICEMVWGRSFSKLFTKTKIVNLYGGKPTTWQILQRSLLKILPFEPLTFLNSDVGWHDRYSDTIVVRIEKLNEFFMEKQ